MLSTKMRTFCWEYYNSLIKVLLGNNIEYLVSTLVLILFQPAILLIEMIVTSGSLATNCLKSNKARLRELLLHLEPPNYPRSDRGF